MNGLTILEPTFVDFDSIKKTKHKNKKFDTKKINELIDKIKDSIPESDSEQGSNIR